MPEVFPRQLLDLVVVVRLQPGQRAHDFVLRSTAEVPQLPEEQLDTRLQLQSDVFLSMRKQHRFVLLSSQTGSE